jgi:hypothetical protein
MTRGRRSKKKKVCKKKVETYRVFKPRQFFTIKLENLPFFLFFPLFLRFAPLFYKNTIPFLICILLLQLEKTRGGISITATQPLGLLPGKWYTMAPTDQCLNLGGLWLMNPGPFDKSSRQDTGDAIWRHEGLCARHGLR